ncbi:LpqB family beta-propeller domain-containing protein [Pseudotabrizicola alkalilacus]|uniref:LpqB family beta-propeller domain-containing protein n=1 Tax=Pseudotabrizicola alkalilacus TaxID=2305252 RepID=UPI001314E027|nr:LpqB family beta-propeller domain-containing protein [Pseudotabrizicola alkalilacus]
MLQAVLVPGAAVLVTANDLGAVLHRARLFDGAVGALALSPDGAHLAALGVGMLRVWALADGDAVLARRAEAQTMTFAQDGQSVWLGDATGGLQRVDLAGETGEAMPYGGIMTGLRPDMALSAQGVLARTSYRMEQQPDGFFAQRYTLYPTTPDGARVVALPDTLRDVLTVDLSTDGTRVAFAGANEDDYTAQWTVMDLATGTTLGGELLQQGFGWVDRLRFTPEGRLVLVGGEGGDIREVVPQTGARFATYGAPLEQVAGAIALPDAVLSMRSVAAGGCWIGTWPPGGWCSGWKPGSNRGLTPMSAPMAWCSACWMAMTRPGWPRWSWARWPRWTRLGPGLCMTPRSLTALANARW